MKTLWLLTTKSIINRRVAFTLSLISIAISVVLLLGIDRITKATKTHFLNTINHTDLIAAAPEGSLDVLLNLVFHLGEPLKEIPYSSYQEISKFDEVAWAFPLSVGDSFKNYDAIATTNEYFRHYKYGLANALSFSKGGNFKEFYDVILGSEVAEKLHLSLHDTIHLSHSANAHTHANRDFHICGILKPTHTPNDKTVFFQLKADEAIHLEWQSGNFVDMHLTSAQLEKMKIEPKHISGIYIGLKSPFSLLHVSEKIEHLQGAHLKAIIPAKALSQLTFLLKNMQELLSLIAAIVFVAALFGMLATMLATLSDRRREIAILRMLGASVGTIFLLFALESFIIVTSGIVLGNIALTLLILFNNLILNQAVEIGLFPDIYELSMLGGMLILAIIASFLPALKSYKNSLLDGLIVKI